MVKNHHVHGCYKKGEIIFFSLGMAVVKLVLECCVWFKCKHCLKALDNKELKRVPCMGTMCTYLMLEHLLWRPKGKFSLPLE